MCVLLKHSTEHGQNPGLIKQTTMHALQMGTKAEVRITAFKAVVEQLWFDCLLVHILLPLQPGPVVSSASF